VFAGNKRQRVRAHAHIWKRYKLQKLAADQIDRAQKSIARFKKKLAPPDEFSDAATGGDVLKCRMLNTTPFTRGSQPGASYLKVAVNWDCLSI